MLAVVLLSTTSYAQETKKDTVKTTSLDEVIITATQKYGEKQSTDIARMPLKNIENPQVYSVIPKEIIKNQILVSNREIINNAVGVVAFNNPTGAITAWIRGFETRNAIRNGMATQFRAESDPINIERMEVVKGPTGTLYGANAVSFGGLINKVTKIPYDQQKTEFAIYAGSFNLARLTVDTNQPLNKDKSVLFRLNAAYNYQDTFQDIGYYKNTTISPSLMFKVNDRFNVLIDAEFATVKNTAMPYPNLSGGYFKNFNEIPLAYDKYIGGEDVDAKTNVTNIFVKAVYKISDHWTSSTHINSSAGFVDFSYLLYPRWTSASTIERNVGLYSGRKLSFMQFQQNFNGDVKIFGLRNRILLGADYTKTDTKLNFQWVKYDDIDVNKDFAPITRAKIDAILGSGNAGHWNSTEYNSSVYLSDVINFTEHLSVLLSGRFDHYKNDPSIANNTKQDDGYEQNFFSPKIGIVYELLKDRLSLFGNYMNGFINQGPVSQPDGSQLVLKPKKAYQQELGLKAQLLQKKLFGTLSFYEINVNDATFSDANNFTQQNGEQKSRGFEFELIAQLNHLSLISGIAYNENKFIDGEPGLIGKGVQGSPKNMYNLWADYKIPEGFLQNIRIGAGGNYVSSVYWDAANSIIIPHYTIVNASILYEGANWSAGLKFNNITDQKYWNSDAQAQNPRNVVGTASFRF
nr:TonB-dependent receptor [Chryseobacterium sp. SSA4.19]